MVTNGGQHGSRKSKKRSIGDIPSRCEDATSKTNVTSSLNVLVLQILTFRYQQGLHKHLQTEMNELKSETIIPKWVIEALYSESVAAKLWGVATRSLGTVCHTTPSHNLPAKASVGCSSCIIPRAHWEGSHYIHIPVLRFLDVRILPWIFIRSLGAKNSLPTVLCPRQQGV